MPIYEFECSACGDSFERLQKLSDPDPSVCPQCGEARIKRRLTAPAFRLSGSGWYETDFKKDGDRKRNLTAKDEAPKADAKADAKGAKPESKDAKKDVAKPESKPAATPAAKPDGAAGA
jgi:putative FmdB family regulatory protein